jgi:hypothetical protein
VIGDIREFIDRLRNQQAPALQDVSSIDPEFDKRLREAHQGAVQGMLDAVDGIEERLLGLYEAGADNPAAIGALDEAMAIIRRAGLTDSQRVEELAFLFGAGDQLR